MADSDSSKRQVAFKVSVEEIMNNKYIKEDGWLPNYIAVGDKKVSRVNIIGVIVSKDIQETDVVSQNFILDDGSGRLPLRFFEPKTSIEIGDVVAVIGRPREFGAERYLVPEIIKKIEDQRWVNVRRIELALEKQRMRAAPVQKIDEPAEELSVETEEFVEDSNPLNKMLRIIKEMDSGTGADFEDLSNKLGSSDAEALVKKLLEQGDVFEVKPGRYKVLE